MLTFIQNSWHYILAALTIGCVTALAITGHLQGPDAAGIAVALAGGGLISGTATSTVGTGTVPTVPTATPVAGPPSSGTASA